MKGYVDDNYLRNDGDTSDGDLLFSSINKIAFFDTNKYISYDGEAGMNIVSDTVLILSSPQVVVSSSSLFLPSDVSFSNWNGAMVINGVTGGKSFDFFLVREAYTELDALAFDWTDGNFNVVNNIKIGRDIYTTGAGDDLWLGTATQASANFRAYATGEVHIDADNIPISLGEGQDTDIYYNGTDLIINPKVVGSGMLDILGNVTIERDLNVVGDTTIGGEITVNKITATTTDPIDTVQSWTTIDEIQALSVDVDTEHEGLHIFANRDTGMLNIYNGDTGDIYELKAELLGNAKPYKKLKERYYLDYDTMQYYTYSDIIENKTVQTGTELNKIDINSAKEKGEVLTKIIIVNMTASVNSTCYKFDIVTEKKIAYNCVKKEVIGTEEKKVLADGIIEQDGELYREIPIYETVEQTTRQKFFVDDKEALEIP